MSGGNLPLASRVVRRTADTVFSAQSLAGSLSNGGRRVNRNNSSDKDLASSGEKHQMLFSGRAA